MSLLLSVAAVRPRDNSLAKQQTLPTYINLSTEMVIFIVEDGWLRFATLTGKSRPAA